MKNIKKKALILTLVLAMMAGTFGATVAWMTAESTLENVFTVGTFTNPENKPTDPDTPIPDEDKDKGEDGTTRLNGNLYEPSWVADSKLVPGATIAKDPYVGIGKGSENAYVYVYVEPTIPNKNGTVGFYINNGWKAVEGYADWNYKYADSDGANARDTDNFYTEGLFVYTGGLQGDADKDVWTTTPLFSNIIVQGDATVEDLGTGAATEGTEDNTIVVKSLVHQKTSGDGTTDLSATALEAAKSTLGAVAITEETNGNYLQTEPTP